MMSLTGTGELKDPIRGQHYNLKVQQDRQAGPEWDIMRLVVAPGQCRFPSACPRTSP